MTQITYLVLIVSTNASIYADRVVICGRPVFASVTVITGHPKVKNLSNVSKNMPHDRLYLLGRQTYGHHPERGYVPGEVAELKLTNIRRVHLNDEEC